ncbi:hypothetical protein [Blastococcus sp. TF02A-26]|uniref:hypothetical protein n=1 Tax=Blastococcus sp. TF02A-26 TaxID=2250577 RepID=UPI0011BE893B|nr:hypothetical protein [Blastococcus sp. TF02A-26]
MDQIPGEAEAGERLKQTALRDFTAVPPGYEPQGTSYKLTLSPHDAPVPALLRYALTLIGLEARGPAEKVAWWVDFMFRNERCELAHQKFGLRLYVRTDASPEEARKTQVQIIKKLRSSMRTVERLILDAAPELLAKGQATVKNQHASLRRAYEYFRERALNPVTIEDERITHEPVEGALLQPLFTFRDGKIQMQMNAFHDMIAAISAYISLLEHDLVLALAFSNFNPDNDDLTAVIGSRWGEKFDRLRGKEGDAAHYRQRLTDVVERWRNPYSHGGFEKGHGATIYLHTPGVGSAVPVGLTGVRSSPLFSLLPASETDIAEVFELFDELDDWLRATLSEAFQWIESDLNVRFDEQFLSLLALARQEDDFAGFLNYFEYRQATIDNMDY